MWVCLVWVDPSCGVICNGVRWCGCGVLICGSGFWVVVVQWRCRAVVMETTPVEVWRLAFDGF